ncbi:hypothetical protein M413DRAFT_269070 [Hebeloma cylindrosporum]|uniref:Uncharacterized protein n=1 Tax=Hebeloma cylindrosporum TaxID=76867 RepID=A0A0C2Z1L5_HEBCY|nr:hypothetical protein M413DRAFT_269070 [Hebeloma cylindrosporum h7]
MMLVQKPQSIFPISPAHTHRRAPSAPVVVQPTRTPGLLTLSKPPRSSAKAHLPSQQRHAAKSATKPTKSIPVARAQLLTPAPEIPDRKPAMQLTPCPQPRGRSHAKLTKESGPVPSPSPSLRGKHGRQPSPTQLPTPQQTPSQAEVKSNLFNVFSSCSPPPSPTKPTGKLARRRQQLPSPPASPMPTKAIPVPQPNIASTHNMAYSDPFPLARPLAQRPFSQQDFRLVDDTDHDSVLTTPSRPAFSMPLPRSSFGKHRRSSSDIFPMSDEDASTSSSGSDLHTALFKNYHLNKSSSASLTTTPPRSRQSSPSSGMSSTEARLEREANEKAGYFASSVFQNSPSPEELPDPMLL